MPPPTVCAARSLLAVVPARWGRTRLVLPASRALTSHGLMFAVSLQFLQAWLTYQGLRVTQTYRPIAYGDCAAVAPLRAVWPHR
jgi:hypothetical protein